MQYDFCNTLRWKRMEWKNKLGLSRFSTHAYAICVWTCTGVHTEFCRHTEPFHRLQTRESSMDGLRERFKRTWGEEKERKRKNSTYNKKKWSEVSSDKASAKLPEYLWPYVTYCIRPLPRVWDSRQGRSDSLQQTAWKQNPSSIKPSVLMVNKSQNECWCDKPDQESHVTYKTYWALNVTHRQGKSKPCKQQRPMLKRDTKYCKLYYDRVTIHDINVLVK